MNKLLSKIKCLLGRHVWGGHDNNTCINCNKKAIGLPKFKSYLPPPKKSTFSLVEEVVVLEK